MKRLVFIAMLLVIPAAVFGMEQSFTQPGLKATVRLSPEKLEPHARMQLTLRLEQDGRQIDDRDVRLSVYEKGSAQPFVSRKVDLLDGEYVDSWQFAQAGDYRVVVAVANPQKPDEAMQYELAASVPATAGDHDMSSHHSGSGWKWLGMGAMMLIMVPMMIIAL